MSDANFNIAEFDVMPSRPTMPKAGAKPKPKARVKSTASVAAKAKTQKTKSLKAKAKPQKKNLKSSRKIAPKAKASPSAASGVAPSPAPEQSMRNWTACYVYSEANGTGKMAMRKIRAANPEEAKEIAAKNPPSVEFMLTIVPESDEQFLGQVRHKAITQARNKH